MGLTFQIAQQMRLITRFMRQRVKVMVGAGTLYLLPKTLTRADMILGMDQKSVPGRMYLPTTAAMATKNMPKADFLVNT